MEREDMSEAEKARGSPCAPPYSSPDPPPPGLPYTQQLAPPQQTLTVQTQPPPPTGPQYYTQLAYPAPQVVLAQPQQPIVATQQGLMRPRELSTKLPKYAFVTSMVATAISIVCLWLPGLLCVAPAAFMGIMALIKKKENKLKQAKHFSIVSFVLVLTFTVSYPILATTVALASVFSFICKIVYTTRGSYAHSTYIQYYRSPFCTR